MLVSKVAVVFEEVALHDVPVRGVFCRDIVLTDLLIEGEKEDSPDTLGLEVIAGERGSLRRPQREVPRVRGNHDGHFPFDAAIAATIVDYVPTQE